MRVRTALLGLVMTVVGCAFPIEAIAGGQADPPQCPYLPEFKVLHRKLPAMKPARVLVALERYRANHENPAACEGIEIDRLMADQEIKLVYLTDGKTRLYAQAAYRCGELDEKTTRCDGSVADGTVFPHYVGIRPLNLTARQRMSINSEVPGIQLMGVYRASLPELIDGKTATRLEITGNTVDLGQMGKNAVLIVIFRAPAPWIYRKLVWYF